MASHPAARPRATTPRSAVALRIEGDRLSGRSCGSVPKGTRGGPVLVGVQRASRPGELLDPTPGDADTATWTLPCTVRPGRDGAPDPTGLYVQGPPGGRFVYLSWVTLAPDGAFAMFRRAKLMLSAVAPAVLADAVRTGRLTARLGLSDAEGEPLCAAVVPPAVRWSAG